MTRILLTNDDGIDSPGIAVLRRAVDGLGDVVTIAPDTNRSAVARSITIDRPLRPRPVTFGDGWQGYAVDGMPSDCVRIALVGFAGAAPDLVVSGVNLGGNMGVDVAYSGTVAAALEAAVRGLPGLAFSVESRTPRWLDESEPLLRGMVALALGHGLPEATALNVNLPDRPAAEIGSRRVTRLGGVSCHDRLQLATTVGGREVVSDHDVPCDRAPAAHWAATDFETVAAGDVSVTPLACELFGAAAFELPAAWELNADLTQA